MKLLLMFIGQIFMNFQNPLEDEANYKTNKKSKRNTFNAWLLKTKSARNYKMQFDTVVEYRSVFYDKNNLSTKFKNYKMPNN